MSTEWNTPTENRSDLTSSANFETNYYYGEIIMLKKKFMAGVIAAAAFITIVGANVPSVGAQKKTATFKVRIENISSPDGVAGQNGQKYPFALSPGLFYANHKSMYFFDEGKKANAALEAQAEDGNPELLSKKLLTKVGSSYMGIFNTPVGSDKAGPLLPGGVYEFTFNAEEGMRLNLIAMYGQSNDLFYAPRKAWELFSKDGVPLSGELTEQLLLWDAGTEQNQAPGMGDEQAPRQKMANTGATENGVVRTVSDGFSYPGTKDVLRVTITAQ